MFAVWLMVWLFLAAYGWGMGQTPEYRLNAFGKFMVMSFFITTPALYLLPTNESWRNQHPNFTAIALANIFLSWSLLGRVAAVVWAFKKPEPTAVLSKSVDAHTVAPLRTPQPVRKVKTCKFCAEDVLAAAVKCKHCGSDVAA